MSCLNQLLATSPNQQQHRNHWAPPQLETLKLGWCKVAGGDGARALSDLLLLNSTLVHLDLRGNGLGNDGAILLSRGLKVGAAMGGGWLCVRQCCLRGRQATGRKGK